MDEKQMKEDLRKLADYIYDWCERIDTNGGGWDEWDDCYKDAYWNQNEEIYKLIRKYMTPKDGNGI